MWYFIKFVATASSATILTCNSLFDGVLDLPLRRMQQHEHRFLRGDDFIAGGSEHFRHGSHGRHHVLRAAGATMRPVIRPTDLHHLRVRHARGSPNDGVPELRCMHWPAAGDAVVIDSTNVGATDGEGIGFNTVWEAFSVDGVRT